MIPDSRFQKLTRKNNINSRSPSSDSNCFRTDSETDTQTLFKMNVHVKSGDKRIEGQSSRIRFMEGDE